MGHVLRRSVARQITREAHETLNQLSLLRECTSKVPRLDPLTLTRDPSIEQVTVQLEMSDHVHAEDCSADSTFSSGAEFLLNSSEPDSSDTGESDSQESASYSIDSELRSWAVNHSVTHSALHDLLQTLKKHSCFHHLPSDSRTLLRTPRQTEVTELKPGIYCHFGIENELKRLLSDVKGNIMPKITLQMNVDGLPITKSTNRQFWPILIHFMEINSIFVSGIYCGDKKPECVNNFLSKTVSELEALMRFGLEIDKKRIPVFFNAFVCDAPARAYITAIKNHTGYYGCGKCCAKGEWIKGRVVITELDAQLRTNESFRHQSDENHHLGISELVKLEVDLIRDFPYEYMHLVCLGVVKKLLKIWIRGDFRIFRLGSHQIESISEALLSLRPSIPVEFARKPRSLRELDRWKATEFRQFLLYSGPVVLKNNLPTEHYELFMCLHVAITILIGKTTYLTHNQFANELLRYFVQKLEILYGKEHISYNVHGLIHLSEDARSHGPLDCFSAYKFENHLGTIKRLLKSPTFPLQQVHRRLVEKQNAHKLKNLLESDIQFLKPHSNGPTSISHGLEQFALVKFKSFEINCSKFGNNICQLENGALVKVENILKDENCEYLICGYEYKQKRNFYTIPCESSQLSSYVVERHCDLLHSWPISSLRAKCVLLPACDNKSVVFPLLHSDS
jgi:hypothetical protein